MSPLARVLDTVRLARPAWTIVIAAIATPVVVVEITKLLGRRRAIIATHE